MKLNLYNAQPFGLNSMSYESRIANSDGVARWVIWSPQGKEEAQSLGLLEVDSLSV